MPTSTLRTVAGLLAAFGFVAQLHGAAPVPAIPAKPVDYSRDIRPILANTCYACHGPDEGKRKAKLRLDVRDDALRKAIKPGDAAHSELIARVRSKEQTEVMPPPAAKKGRLTNDQVDLLRRWIDQGAKFDTHWAYLKPVRPAVPAVKDAAWPANAIDRFITTGHEKNGFTAAPDADPITLLRRLRIWSRITSSFNPNTVRRRGFVQ